MGGSNAYDTQPEEWSRDRPLTVNRQQAWVCRTPRDDVVRACELAADHELQGIYNVGTEESYTFNEMVAVINAELGTDVDPKYIENPLEVYVHDTMADYAKLHEATAWEPTIDFEEGVKRVCEPYTDAAVAEN